MKIGVCYSESHPVRLEEFEDVLFSLGEYETTLIEVPAGSVDQPADDVLVDGVRDCDGLWVRAGAIGRRVIESAPNLAAIQTNGSGFDHVDVEAATEHGISVSHNPDAPGPAVAEHVVGLMLCLIRQLPRAIKRCSRGNWLDARGSGFPELQANTVGVVGVGTIGYRVCEILRDGFGTDVVAYDPYVSGERESRMWPRVTRRELEDLGVTLVELDVLFDRSDLVTIHVPHTAETDEFVGETHFAKLQDGYLINASRGKVLDERALATAVESGGFAGVALDVLQREPPDPDNPLLRSDSVIVTPHVGGASRYSDRRAARLAAHKLHRLLNEGRTETMVN